MVRITVIDQFAIDIRITVLVMTSLAALLRVLPMVALLLLLWRIVQSHALLAHAHLITVASLR